MHFPLGVLQIYPTFYASGIKNKRSLLLLHSNILQGFIITTLSFLARDEKAAFKDELSVIPNASLRKLKIMSVDKTISNYLLFRPVML